MVLYLLIWWLFWQATFVVESELKATIIFISMLRTLISFYLASIICVPLNSQNRIVAPKAVFLKDELLSDFKIFRASLEEGHPALYWYKSKAEMDSIFDSNYASIQTSLTDIEFTILLSKIVSQIGDGHLRVILPKVHKDKLDGGSTAFPLTLFFSQGKLFITRNISSHPDDDLIGSQIVSINDKLVSEFLKEYIKLIPSDGANLTNKYRILSRLRILPRYFYMLYGFTEEYRLTYIPYGATNTKTILIKGITYDDYFETLDKRYPPSPSLEFVLNKVSNYACLKIKSFDKEQLKEEKLTYNKFLKNAFEKLREDSIDNLIIDLRGNSGGTDEYGKILYSYFTDKPFLYYTSITMNKQSFDFFKYTGNPDAKAPKGMLEPNVAGTFDNVKHPNIGLQSPKHPTFKGKIYVLIDGGCFSTTSEFLSVLDFNTNTVFIGEESGGGYYGNCSGPAREVILPNTKVGLAIPLMRYNMAVSEHSPTNTGIIPDHIIQTTIKDRMEGIDPVLEEAKFLITRSSGNLKESK